MKRWLVESLYLFLIIANLPAYFMGIIIQKNTFDNYFFKLSQKMLNFLLESNKYILNGL